MSKRCLLLRLPDSREVFTHEKYHNTLLEFAKSFGVKILTVEADFPNLLHPKDIAKIFCDQNKEVFNTCSYRVVSHQPSTTKTINQHTSFSSVGAREKMLQKVSDVRSYIESQFLEGNTVRIKELHHRFQKHNIAVSTLYRHLSYVKDRLKAQGRQVVKVAAGCYRLA